jgi:tripartite-type tricarboxylate transporter receptor subunit TctC
LNEVMQQYNTPEAGRRLAQVILTAATLGRPVATTPGTPPERVKILREAYARAITDPDLLAEAAKQNWEVNPLTGEELQTLSQEVIRQPKEVIARMKWVLGRE